MSSSSSPPVVPQHCSTVLYELLKCEEEPCRVWLRDEMNQIPDPLIDSLFHGLICSSSSSAVPQSRQTVSELCQQLQGEMGQLRMVLRGEMDRVVNTLTEKLTNKLRMTNLDDMDREEDGDDRSQVDQVVAPTPQPSTSTFNPVPHQQHSNGDEVQLNTVEMIEIKEEVEEEEDGEAQIDEIEGWAEDNQSGDDECQALDNVPLNTTLTHPTGQSQLTVTQSADLLAPQTTAQEETSPTALDQQTTVPTPQKVTKRKQQTSIRTGKRSKKTIEEDVEDEEDFANEDREEAKVKILHLNCTQSNCNVKLDSMVHFNDHIRTVHQLSPFRCYATNCNLRFDSPRQIFEHIQQNHSRNTRFLCSVCPKERDSQHKANIHWYQNHLTGQFQCNLVRDCAQVTDTRAKMTTHQLAKHYSQSKHFHCTHPGCTASFAFKTDMKRHELIHLATNQFHCNWPHCSKQCKLRANLIMHIRMQHFGLPQTVKAQKEKNIVDLRDPNEYVRVVVDE